MDTRSYLGGLITGEGCFCFAVQRRRGRATPNISPVFAMFMSDRDTIMGAADMLSEIGLPVYISERPKAGRNQVGIHISGFKRVRRYCEELIPYLTGQKLEAATLVLEFINSRQSHSKMDVHNERELEIVRRSREVNGNTRGRKNPL